MTRPLSPNYYSAGQERERQKLYILQKKKAKERERNRAEVTLGKRERKYVPVLITLFHC